MHGSRRELWSSISHVGTVHITWETVFMRAQTVQLQLGYMICGYNHRLICINLWLQPQIN